jgi:SRSO17 transposase
MKTNQEIKDSVGQLTEVEKTRIKYIQSQLEALIKKQIINEESYRMLGNIAVEIHSLKEQYTNRLITLLKRGDEI